jgi:hypothetical protein
MFGNRFGVLWVWGSSVSRSVTATFGQALRDFSHRPLLYWMLAIAKTRVMPFTLVYNSIAWCMFSIRLCWIVKGHWAQLYIVLGFVHCKNSTLLWRRNDSALFLLAMRDVVMVKKVHSRYRHVSRIGTMGIFLYVVSIIGTWERYAYLGIMARPTTRIAQSYSPHSATFLHHKMFWTLHLNRDYMLEAHRSATLGTSTRWMLRISVFLSWHNVCFPTSEGFDSLLCCRVCSNSATDGHEESLQR